MHCWRQKDGSPRVGHPYVSKGDYFGLPGESPRTPRGAGFTHDPVANSKELLASDREPSPLPAERAEMLKVIEDALLPAKGWLAPEALTFARQDARKVYDALVKNGAIRE